MIMSKRMNAAICLNGSAIPLVTKIHVGNPINGIPINGDVRTGSVTLKQAVSLYVQFRQHPTG